MVGPWEIQWQEVGVGQKGNTSTRRFEAEVEIWEELKGCSIQKPFQGSRAMYIFWNVSKQASAEMNQMP